MSTTRTITSALSIARLARSTPFAFDGVCGLSQTRGVGDPKRNASQACEFLDRISRGSRTGTHDSPIESQQAVEEAGFSGIRRAAKDQADSFAQNSAFIRGREQAFDPATEMSISASNLSPVCGSMPSSGKSM